MIKVPCEIDEKIYFVEKVETTSLKIKD
jgi:hypothetical protein